MGKKEQTHSVPATRPLMSGTAVQVQQGLLEALRAERSHGFWALRFQGNLEHAFRDHLARSARETRLAMFVIVMVMLIATPWYSFHFLQEPVAIAAYLHLLNYIQIPTLMVGAVLTWYRPLSLYVDRLCILAAMSAIVCILVQRSIAAPHDFDIPLEYVGVAVVSLVFVARIRFWHTFPWAIMATIAMVVNEWLYVVPPLDGYFRILAACTLIAIVCIGGYSHEYFMRQSWISNRLLKYLSSYDSMTNLLNRRSLHKEMQRIIMHSQRERCAFAIAMIDIDYFKNYNDVYGHDKGDKVIQHIAGLLRDSARRPQDFCGRYGGEEFIIAWVDGPYQELFTLADTLRQRVEQAEIPHIASPISDFVTVSIGFYWIDPNPGVHATEHAQQASDDNTSALIGKADEQLYKAKFSGRNCVVGKQAEASACKQTAVASQP